MQSFLLVKVVWHSEGRAEGLTQSKDKCMLNYIGRASFSLPLRGGSIMVVLLS